MPDWDKLVHRRLYGLALAPAERDEVHAELAAHLEEAYEGFRKQGLPEREAVRRTLEQVSGWKHLQLKIYAAKNGGHLMQKRLHQLWIPGFLALILSMLFLAAFQILGFQPRIASSNPNTIFFYVPWLLSLPFFGALGTYLSSRAGGSRGTALLASVFPVLALAGAFLSMFPIGSVLGRIIGRRVGFSDVASTLLRDGIGWLLVPGAVLLTGGLLAQLFASPRLTQRNISHH